MWPFKNWKKKYKAECVKRESAQTDVVRYGARIESMAQAHRDNNEAKDRKLHERRAEIARLTGENRSLNSTLEDLQALKGQSDGKAEFYEGEAQKAEAEVKCLKGSIDELTAENTRLRENSEGLLSNIQEKVSTIEELTADNDRLLASNTKLGQNIGKQADTIERYQQDNSRLNGLLEESDVVFKKLQSTVEDRDAEIVNLQGARAKLLADIERQDGIMKSRTRQINELCEDLEREKEASAEYRKLLPKVSEFMAEFNDCPDVRLLQILNTIYTQCGEDTQFPLVRDGKALNVPQTRGISRDKAAQYGYRLEELWRHWNDWPEAVGFSGYAKPKEAKNEDSA